MSQFDDAFSSAVAVLSDAFSDQAVFEPLSSPGSAIPVSVVVNRDVHSMESMAGAVGAAIELSWRIGSLDSPKDGIFTLTKTGERFKARELVGDDGFWITYRVIKA